MNVIGIDIGGTKTLAALVRVEDGKILHRLLKPTNTSSPELFVQGLIEIIRDLIALDISQKPVAIGIGTAGHVEPRFGNVSSMNLGVSNLPLRTLISEAFGLPVFIDNDCNAGAVGEMFYGAAQGKKHFAFLTVGTGVGVGLVLNGEVYHGKCNYAGEIGHVGIDFDGVRCKCGGWGCLENIASGPGMVELVKAELAKGRPSVLELCHTNSAQEIFAAARQRDPLCVEIVEQAARALGYSIRNLNNLLDLELVVLGGGIPQAMPEVFVDYLQSYLEEIDNRVNLAASPIVISDLYPASIVLGAARLVPESYCVKTILKG